MRNALCLLFVFCLVMLVHTNSYAQYVESVENCYHEAGDESDPFNVLFIVDQGAQSDDFKVTIPVVFENHVHTISASFRTAHNIEALNINLKTPTHFFIIIRSLRI